MRRGQRRLHSTRTVVWAWTGAFILLALLFFKWSSSLPSHKALSRHLIEPTQLLHDVHVLVHTSKHVHHDEKDAQPEPPPPRPCGDLEGEAYIACYRSLHPVEALPAAADASQDALPRVFLFIGILSGTWSCIAAACACHSYHRSRLPSPPPGCA